MKVGVIDYGIGNIGSVVNMIRHIGANVDVITEPNKLNYVDKLILPGVGSFDRGITELRERGFIEPLHECVFQRNIQLLGICLGMQLLMKSSEEGNLQGLGWVEGDTKKFNFEGIEKPHRLPHMGWNIVKPTHYGSLFKDRNMEYRFYFVHSYHVMCDEKKDILASAHYGYDFVCALEHNNIFGVQFHPEKSHKFGMELLNNYLEL